MQDILESMSLLLPLTSRLRLTLVSLHRMQHNLIHALRRMMRIPFTPIIARRIRKNASSAIKRRRRYRLPNFWKPLESVLGILVPEVKCSV